jgi:hypothetical protein
MKKEYWMAGIGIVLFMILIALIWIPVDKSNVKEEEEVHQHFLTKQITFGANAKDISQNVILSDNKDNTLNFNFSGLNIKLLSEAYSGGDKLGEQPDIRYGVEDKGEYWKYSIETNGSGSYDLVLSFDNPNVKLVEDYFVYGDYILRFNDIEEYANVKDLGGGKNETTYPYTLIPNVGDNTLLVKGCSDYCYLDPTVAFNSTNTAIGGDTKVLSCSGDSNYGSETTMQVSRSGATLIWSYIIFDTNLSEITDGTIAITDAELKAYTSADSVEGSTIQVSNMTNNTWSETLLTWNNRPTGNEEVIDTETTYASPAWVDFNVTTAVQSYYTAGWDNMSFKFNFTESDGNWDKIITKEHASTHFHPTLTITYTFSPTPRQPEINASANYTNTVYDGDTTNITLNLSWSNATISDIESATLRWNNTDYTGSRAYNGTEHNITFYHEITVPDFNLTSATIPLNWTYSIVYTNGSEENRTTDAYNQVVNLTGLYFCNSTYNHSYLNFTYEDETTSAAIRANVSSAILNYTHNSYTKTLTFTNSSSLLSHAFCYYPVDRGLNMTIPYYYYAGGGYPQRTYSGDLVLPNTTTNRTLYLLSSGSGQYVTFQVVNEADQSINEVLSEVRESGTLIESRYTDDAGATTFWLNADQTYTFTFSKAGYNNYSTTMQPTQTSYTMTLTSNTTGTVNINIMEGVTYSILPANMTLSSNMTYNFSFIVESNEYVLQEAGFNLTNNESYSFGSATCTGDTGCTATGIFNTTSNSSVIMNYYFQINNTYANGTHAWGVFLQYTGNYSLLYIIRHDFQNLGSGFNDFTKAIISIIIIVVVIGGLSIASGTLSPLAIVWELFALVFLLESISFVPSLEPVTNAVPYFYTIVVGILAAGYTIYDHGSGK